MQRVSMNVRISSSFLEVRSLEVMKVKCTFYENFQFLDEDEFYSSKQNDIFCGKKAKIFP